MIDHIVLAVPNLAGAVAGLRRLTGIRPAMGGSHIGHGTADYLVGLGVPGTSKASVRPPINPTRPSHGRSGIDGLTASGWSPACAARGTSI
jgi:hypothetical protein